VNVKQREELIAQYRDGYRAVAEALLKISDEELDARPGPGRWSAREIVHHLADSEMNAAMRLRLLLAEDTPAIKGIDQNEFARKLYYDRPHQSSLEAFRWARQTTAELLERMGPAEWVRDGTHSEIGRFGVEEWLRIYAPHAHSHARQIREARSAVAN
jgi:uncharacterized damage-inducible protein DinB